jgi:hypothetical protein
VSVPDVAGRDLEPALVLRARQPIVGLCGYSGAGKDCAAEGLLAVGWARVGFSDPLKAMAKAMGWNGTKDGAGRILLQSLGMAARHHIDPDVWVQAAERMIDRTPEPVVMPDTRFDNEVAMIHRRGGLVVLIDRPGRGPVNGHASENVDLDIDVTLRNDRSPSELRATLVGLVGHPTPVPAPLSAPEHPFAPECP